MFERNLLKYLHLWKNKQNRKPLIVRGARQVGKTVTVALFGKTYSNFISVNLENESERRLFDTSKSLTEVIQAIEVMKKVRLSTDNTLLFIDEIQASPKAISMLRFFYEEKPELHVIAAGSLIEAVMKHDGFSFPVGRVEFCCLHPVTFDEYLRAMGEHNVLEILNNADFSNPPSEAIHELALKHYLDYMKVGGMPEAVRTFADTKSYQELVSIKDSLIQSFEDDVAKYSTHAESTYLRHVIEQAPFEAGMRITYERFGRSNYRSREMSRAFDLLERARIVTRIHGTTANCPPLRPNFRVSPKLLYLDIGLVTQKMGMGEHSFDASSTDHFFRGRIAEQVVGQELKARSVTHELPLGFWYRQRSGKAAEIDYIIQHGDSLVPIEVKSGSTGRLRSLHQFLQSMPNNLGVRVSPVPLKHETITIAGEAHRIISIPFYLAWRIDSLL